MNLLRDKDTKPITPDDLVGETPPVRQMTGEEMVQQIRRINATLGGEER